MNNKAKQQFHFFAVDAFGWATSDTWEKALKKRQKDSGTKTIYTCVYRVPVAEDAHYKIVDFKPVIEGIELVYLQHNKTKKES